MNTHQQTPIEQKLCIVITTVDSENIAHTIAKTLVQERLAACCSVLPNLVSFYHWQGETVSSSEYLLLIKIPESLYDSLEQRIRELHPYSLPEIISLQSHRVFAPYLQWVYESTINHS